MEEEIQNYLPTVMFLTANVYNIYNIVYGRRHLKLTVMFRTANVYNIYNTVYGRRHLKLFTNCYVSYCKCL